MLTPDEKESCKEEIKNAYQSVKFYYELKEKGEHTKSFAQTVFSLAEHMIYHLAEKLNLESDVKDLMNERTRENKERSLRIEQLEKEIAESSSVGSFSDNLNLIKKRMNHLWNQQGFESSYGIFIRETGVLDVTLSLKPVEEGWELEEEQDEVPEAYSNSFLQHEFECVEGEDYTYLVEKDRNKDIIENLVKRQFPNARIWDWGRGHQDDKSILTNVNLLVSDLSFMEGKK